MKSRSIMLTPLIVACALFMENLDSTVIATSLPAIAHDLHQDPISLKLALTSYLLALAVFIPASGWAADRFGARTVFRSAIIVFTIGSILCGLSSTLPQFVMARIIQGCGGAMMVPVGRLVMLRSVPRSELVRAMAYLTLPALFGPVIGPPLGGFITTYFQWRYIFWINVPVGLVGIILASIFIENIKAESSPPLDWAGFLFSGLGLSLTVFGMTVAGRGFVPVWLDVGMVLTGLASLALYVRHARTAPNPLLDLRLLGHRTFRASIVGGFLFRLGIGAIPFLLPLMLQVGFGMNPFQSGSLTFAAAAGAMLMKATAAPILKRVGFRTVLVYNALLCSAFLAANSLLTSATPGLAIVALLLTGGFFRSLQFTSINVLAYAEIPENETSRATSFTAVVQQLAVSTGVALGAGAIELSQFWRGTVGLHIVDFATAFIVVAFVSASSVLMFRTLPPEAGAHLAGRVKPA